MKFEIGDWQMASLRDNFGRRHTPSRLVYRWDIFNGLFNDECINWQRLGSDIVYNADPVPGKHECVAHRLYKQRIPHPDLIYRWGYDIRTDVSIDTLTCPQRSYDNSASAMTTTSTARGAPAKGAYNPANRAVLRMGAIPIATHSTPAEEAEPERFYGPFPVSN